MTRLVTIGVSPWSSTHTPPVFRGCMGIGVLDARDSTPGCAAPCLGGTFRCGWSASVNPRPNDDLSVAAVRVRTLRRPARAATLRPSALGRPSVMRAGRRAAVTPGATTGRRMCTCAHVLGVLVSTPTRVPLCTLGGRRPPPRRQVPRERVGGAWSCGWQWPTTRAGRARRPSSPSSPRPSPPAAAGCSPSTSTPRPTCRAGWATARPSSPRWSPPPRSWRPTRRAAPPTRSSGAAGPCPPRRVRSSASTCCPPATTSRRGSPRRASSARTSAWTCALVGVAEDYDVVFLDCPPSLGHLTQLGLAAADTAVLVLRPEYDHLQGAIRVRDFIATYRRHLGRPSLAVAGVIINERDRRRGLHTWHTDSVTDTFGPAGLVPAGPVARGPRRGRRRRPAPAGPRRAGPRPDRDLLRPRRPAGGCDRCRRLNPDRPNDTPPPGRRRRPRLPTAAGRDAVRGRRRPAACAPSRPPRSPPPPAR